MMRTKTLTLTGAAGTAYSTPLSGLVHYLAVDYTAGDAGGDLTLSDDETGLTLLSLISNATDKAGPVRVQGVGTDAVAIAGVYEPLPIVSRVKAVWADHAANTTIVVRVWVDE